MSIINDINRIIDQREKDQYNTPTDRATVLRIAIASLVEEKMREQFQSQESELNNDQVRRMVDDYSANLVEGRDESINKEQLREMVELVCKEKDIEALPALFAEAIIVEQAREKETREIQGEILKRTTLGGPIAKAFEALSIDENEYRTSIEEAFPEFKAQLALEMQVRSLLNTETAPQRRGEPMV